MPFPLSGLLPYTLSSRTEADIVALFTLILGRKVCCGDLITVGSFFTQFVPNTCYLHITRPCAAFLPFLAFPPRNTSLFLSISLKSTSSEIPSQSNPALVSSYKPLFWKYFGNIRLQYVDRKAGKGHFKLSHVPQQNMLPASLALCVKLRGWKN